MIGLLKLALVFAGIVVLLRRRGDLGLLLFAASIAVGLLFGYPLPDIGGDILSAVIDPLTLRLAVVVVFILILGELLRHTASLTGMVESLRELIPSGRAVMAVLPATIGLLPMVGGAMLSAPMVEEVGRQMNADSEQKTFVNYWFRHMWEPMFPVYPSAMLAATFCGLTSVQLAGATWVVTASAMLGGLLFGLLRIRQESEDSQPPDIRWSDSLKQFIHSIWPVALLVILAMALPLDDEIRLVIALLITIPLMIAVKRLHVRVLWPIVRHRIAWKTILVIFGALSFRLVLENCGAVATVSEELTRLNVPLPLVAFAVPFIGGLFTGLMAAAYSIGFPIVIPLIVSQGGAVAPAWAAWLLAGGFLGVMLSPMHLCLSLTREYFKANWGPLYRLLLPSGLLTLAAVAGQLLLA
ncbi:MAG: DUF401 family protein [Anaerolineae bacterium]|nr:DUF401 family protein [Anaerolineae bacterium]